MKKAPSTAWQKGQSGNPKGKPKGAKNRATLLALAAMEGELNAVVRSVIAAAKRGDMTAARLIVDKLIPAAKERPIGINLPNLKNIATCADAQAAVVQAVAAGELLLGEGEALAGLIEHQRRALETHDLTKRLEAIEAKLEGAKS